MIGQTAPIAVATVAPDPKPDVSPAPAGDSEAVVRGESATPSALPAQTDDAVPTTRAREIGGRDGLEPTRYGDWEKNGRCIDF